MKERGPATGQQWVAAMVGELECLQVQSWDSSTADVAAWHSAACWAERWATCLVDQLAAGSVAAMVACGVAGAVRNEAASSVGQSGCEKVDLMVAWSVARTDESWAAQMDSTMAARKVYGKVDGMAAQTVDVKAEMKAGRMDAYSVAWKAGE